MDKETLSNYGWVVICILVLVVMIALATPFGEYIRDAVKNATLALGGKTGTAFSAAGVTMEAAEFGSTSAAA